MFNVNLYDVNVTIRVYNENMLVAKAEQPGTAWMEIHVNNMSGEFDLMGVDQMKIDFIDDDYIVFKKRNGDSLVDVTISKHGIAKMVGEMLEYLANTTPSLFGRDED